MYTASSFRFYFAELLSFITMFWNYFFHRQHNTGVVIPLHLPRCDESYACHSSHAYRISLYFGGCAYMQKYAYFSDSRTSFLARILARAPLFEYKRTTHIPLKMASEQYDYLQNSAIAVLKSAVRRVHVYRIFP